MKGYRAIINSADGSLMGWRYFTTKKEACRWAKKEREANLKALRKVSKTSKIEETIRGSFTTEIEKVVLEKCFKKHLTEKGQECIDCAYGEYFAQKEMKSL